MTIVVPIYNDWNSLSVCIESLKLYVNTCHTILLINDIGPEADGIERRILNIIRDDKRFKYVRNPQNIGFVKTCNRAVFELDKSDNDIMLLNSDTRVTSDFLEEMQNVLYDDAWNGVVCPRSNNATFLSVPVNKMKNEYSADESYAIYQKIKEYLPLMYDLVTGVGFAFLIKRELIKKYGLFDEVFSPGYNEENDFCMRVRKYGYKIIAANKAYIFHDESKSFGSKKKELELKNSAVLLKRYPEYWELTERFLKYSYCAVDYFANAIVKDADDMIRIIIDLRNISVNTNKEFKNCFLFLKKVFEIKGMKKNQEIYILASAGNLRKIKRYFNEKIESFRIFKENQLPTGLYDAAIVYGKLETERQKVFLNNRALRIFEICYDNNNEFLEEISLKINEKINISQLERRFVEIKTIEKLIDMKSSEKFSYYNLLFNIKKTIFIYCNFIFVLKLRVKSLADKVIRNK
ncbi:glycosyltransferase family 2 protein [Kineothrix sp. MB12-C1]|uniref:glycosyltransferase family 2 protein n=1 Tax=Kineothrix sp. MB12-C1 TaxID=3070215 RepID=UPI0027D2F847|nr:glycosyltransferase family 2 protein [Kineothrix sp. MB12-C1]WMC91699.1 glycosyltransferase family 2 protein [Kineothrix sp. MB12-C1]